MPKNKCLQSASAFYKLPIEKSEKAVLKYFRKKHEKGQTEKNYLQKILL
jgi:hypothetical protein